MIIIGTMDWPKTVDSGQFYCPMCESIRSFRRRISRPFLTVYFIPVIPLGGLQEYVECRRCKNNFEPDILNDPTPESERNFSADVVNLAALTMLEDKRITDNEISRALSAIQAIGQIRIGREDLGRACSEMRSKKLGLGSFLFTARRRWSREQCLQMVQVIFLVASAEGTISRNRMNALTRAQKILELSDQEVETCVLEAERVNLDGNDDMLR